MLTTAYDSSIWQVGERWWLLELNVQRLCRQYFSTLQMVDGLRAVGVGSSSELAEAPQPRFIHAQPCKRCWRRLMPNFEPTACGLYARDPHGWKLWCCLIGALGKDQSSSYDAAATR